MARKSTQFKILLIGMVCSIITVLTVFEAQDQISAPNEATSTHEELSPASAEQTSINVQSFGAKPDDIIDDTAAIKKAAASMPATGGTIYFPKGTYLISSISFHSNTQIKGTNAVLKGSSMLTGLVSISGTNTTMDGITLDGAHKTNRGLSILAGSKDITVTNSKFRNFTHPMGGPKALRNYTPVGIRIEGGTSRILIDHCEVRNVYAKNIDKHWGHKVARGILISPANSEQPVSRDVTVQNSLFYGIGPKDDGDGIVIQGWNAPANLKISGNTFVKNHKRAIKIQTPGVTVTGNKIINPFNGNNKYETYFGGNNYDMYAGISVYADDVTVSDNTIGGTGSYSVGIEITSNHVSVTGNKVANGKNANVIEADLIRITSEKTVKGITIMNNTINNGRFGIHLIASVEDFHVKNNVITNVSGQK